MKKIRLTNGSYAIVDNEDYELLSKYKWASQNGYAARSTLVHENRSDNLRRMLMHREIMGARKGQEIDHINRNPLDNRKSNLRFCTRSINNHNMGAKKNSRSGVKGVYFQKGVNKWHVQIMVERSRYYLGLFENLTAAKEAYTQAFKEKVG